MAGERRDWGTILKLRGGHVELSAGAEQGALALASRLSTDVIALR